MTLAASAFFAGVVGAQIGVADWPRQMRVLREETIPFAVLNGSDDPFLNHSWTGKPHDIPEGKHAPFFNKPEVFNGALRGFLREAEGGERLSRSHSVDIAPLVRTSPRGGPAVVIGAASGIVATALLADWSEEKLSEAKESGDLLKAGEVAKMVTFMLTRPEGMTILDVMMLPTNFDL